MVVEEDYSMDGMVVVAAAGGDEDRVREGNQEGGGRFRT